MYETESLFSGLNDTVSYSEIRVCMCRRGLYGNHRRLIASLTIGRSRSQATLVSNRRSFIRNKNYFDGFQQARC